MRAAVLTGINQPLEIMELQVDKPGPREVLIRTVAAGIRHSDLHLKLDELVSRRLILDQINDGFDSLRTGEVARSVIRMGE